MGGGQGSACSPFRLYSVLPGFCQALGSSLTGQSSPAPLSPTAELLQRLFPPLLDALREPRSELRLCLPPGKKGVERGTR